MSVKFTKIHISHLLLWPLCPTLPLFHYPILSVCSFHCLCISVFLWQCLCDFYFCGFCAHCSLFLCINHLLFLCTTLRAAWLLLRWLAECQIWVPVSDINWQWLRDFCMLSPYSSPSASMSVCVCVCSYVLSWLRAPLWNINWPFIGPSRMLYVPLISGLPNGPLSITCSMSAKRKSNTNTPTRIPIPIPIQIGGRRFESRLPQ